ncbi:MAG TPA: CAP domain-containing protein [Rhizomicrobium sp.]
MPALEIRIFDLIQDERHRIDPKAQALMLDSELIGVARQHSRDMALKNYMAHAGPDGQTSTSLIMDEDSDFQGLLGENIAALHYTPQGGVDVEVFAQRFVKTWLDSRGHKENLSFAAYDRSGVGAALSGDTVYVTQLFATEVGMPLRPSDPNSRGNIPLAPQPAEQKARH